MEVSAGAAPRSNVSAIPRAQTGPPYREIDRFTGASDDFDDAHGILLWIGVDEERRAFVVLIRNWHRMGETPFVKALSDDIAAALRRDFPTREVRVERLHDMPIFYVP